MVEGAQQAEKSPEDAQVRTQDILLSASRVPNPRISAAAKHVTCAAAHAMPLKCRQLNATVPALQWFKNEYFFQ